MSTYTRIRITNGSRRNPPGSARTYETMWQASCDCGWQSKWYYRRTDAEWYADEHELTGGCNDY